MTNCQAPKTESDHEEQRGDELRKYLKQVAMGSNEAAADSGHLTRLVARPRDPGSPELPERQNARGGELDRRQQEGRQQGPQVARHDPGPS